MKQETIIRIKLTAEDGMMLTNGEIYGRVIFLGNGDSADNWHEITEAEAQALMETNNTEEENNYV